MTTDRETTRIVRSWIQLGVDRMPERVLDAVLDQLPATPQRRPVWPAWRSPRMPHIVKVLAPLTAVVVLALVGLQLLPAGGIGGPVSTPSPTAPPTPSPSPSPVTLSATDRTPLQPGTYRVPAPAGTPFTLTLPTPWTTAALGGYGVAIERTEPASFGAWIMIDRVDRVFADPCHPDAVSSSPPPSASAAPMTSAELVAALRGLKGFSASPSSDVQIDGHEATSFVLTTAFTDEAAGECDGGPLDIWAGDLGRNTTNQRSSDRIWVVDTDTGPMVIDANSIPEHGGAAYADELDQIVSSIHFEQ